MTEVDRAHAFLEECRAFIKRSRLLPRDSRVLVGVSGGVDSVVLLDVLARLEYDVVVAHVNYALRGEEANRDEALVQELCAEREVDCHVRQLRPGDLEAMDLQSTQEAARDVRYEFFADVAEKASCGCVAVAHQKDDQAETVLHHLVRGSGPEGLAGMPHKRPLQQGSNVELVRPLLWARRYEIEAYARARSLPWRTDVTNRSPKYLRGRLREHVLPCLEEHLDASVVDAIVRSADLLREYVEHDLRPVLHRHFEACAHENEVGGSLQIEYLREQPPVWRRRIILEGLVRWMPNAPRRSSVLEEAEALLESQPGRRLELGSGTIWREREVLRLIPGAEDQTRPRSTILHLGDREVELSTGRLSIEMFEARPDSLDAGTPNVVYIDAGAVEWPLRVRPWEAGDRFQPLGMEGTKAVSDLLTECRVPPHRKGQVVVLEDELGIVWVVGYRLAHRARVRPETRRIAKIAYKSGSNT